MGHVRTIKVSGFQAQEMRTTLRTSRSCEKSDGRRCRRCRVWLAAPARRQSGGARFTDSVTLKPVEVGSADLGFKVRP